jgi:hypothetical protein
LPNNDCRNCHQTENWNTINFDHGRTSFSLLGKHSTITCGSCHREKENERSSIIFSSIKKECEICHKDVHNEQFKVEGISDCSRCHGFENWKPEKFDHSKTEFNLDGAHKNIPCAKCHPQTEVNGDTFIKFKLEDFKCATCHKK